MDYSSEINLKEDEFNFPVLISSPTHKSSHQRFLPKECLTCEPSDALSHGAETAPNSPTKTPSERDFESGLLGIRCDEDAIFARRRLKPLPQNHFNMQNLKQAPFERKICLIRQVLITFSACFTPTYKIQANFNKLLRAFGLEGALFFVAGAYFLEVYPNGRRGTLPVTLSIKADSGFHLEKMELMEIVVDNVSGGFYSCIEEIEDEAAFVGKLPVTYPPFLQVLAFAGICVGTTPFFGGGWAECVVSAFLGAVFGLLNLVAVRYARLRGTFDFWSSVVIGLLCRIGLEVASLFASYDGIHPYTLNLMSIFLPSVLWILPGFSMISGFTDLLYGHKTLAVTNIFGAAFCALNIGVGVFVGFYALLSIEAPFVGNETSTLRDHLYHQYQQNLIIGREYRFYLFLMLFPTIFFVSILFNATPRQMPAMLITAFVSFLIYTLLSEIRLEIGNHGFSDYLGSFASSALEISRNASSNDNLRGIAIKFFKNTVALPEPVTNFVGAAVVGFVASIFSHIFACSTTPIIYGGILLLAPGTWGARSAFEFLRTNFTLGIYRGFNMLTIALFIALGVTFGRTIGGASK